MQNCPFWSVLAEFWVRLQNRNLEFFFWRPSLQTVDSILKSFVACGRAKDWNMFSYCRNYWSHLLSSVLMLLCTHQEYVQAWQDASGTMAGEKFHAWYAVPEGGEAEAVQLPRFLNLPLEVGVAQWLKTKEAWDCKVASLAMEGKVLAPKAKTLHAACLNILDFSNFSNYFLSNHIWNDWPYFGNFWAWLGKQNVRRSPIGAFL